jgi:hypothetical protein
MIKWYFEIWWLIVARPIYFYSVMKEENWREKSLSFMLITAWISAAAAAAAIFIIQYVPIGSTLVEGVKGPKFIFILPVLITLAAVFYLITLLILGGLMVAAYGILSYATGFSLHYIYLWLGGKGSMNRMIQGCLYASAVFLVILLPVFFSLLVRYGGLDFSLFRAGYNFFLSMAVIFLYGLWAVAGRKNYNVPKWKAFAGALIPAIFLLIFQVVFDKIAVSKLQTWIIPLK